MDAEKIAFRLKEVLKDKNSEELLEALCMAHYKCVTFAVLI